MFKLLRVQGEDYAAGVPDSFSLPEDGKHLVIGRDATCDVVVNSLKGKFVSRKHLEIWMSHGRIMIKNLSPNGIRVHDNRVDNETVLHSGDDITIGPALSELHYRVDVAPNDKCCGDGMDVVVDDEVRRDLDVRLHKKRVLPSFFDKTLELAPGSWLFNSADVKRVLVQSIERRPLVSSSAPPPRPVHSEQKPLSAKSDDKQQQIVTPGLQTPILQPTVPMIQPAPAPQQQPVVQQVTAQVVQQPQVVKQPMQQPTPQPRGAQMPRKTAQQPRKSAKRKDDDDDDADDVPDEDDIDFIDDNEIDDDGGDDDDDDDEVPVRERCKYGAKCYRKNPDHKKQFSHPGDDDY